MSRKNVRILFAILLSCRLCWLDGAASAADGDVQVTLKADESLRQVSERLLGDGDAWQLILRNNGLKNPDAVGVELRVPVVLHSRLRQHLERSASLISEANKEGAAVLAEKEIAEAARLREQALRLAQEARLEEAAAQAAAAETAAQAALVKAQQSQTQSAEAWLAAKSGTVQKRPPDASRWQETELKQKLKERERVRTLAKSRCVIQFSDQSQLSLDEDALVVIGSMEKNVLRASSSNSVSMIEGDVLVHIASLSQQKQFNLNLPDIAADVRSRSFLTSHDKKNVTRIANYDGEIDIKAGGGQVTVKKNQATKVKPGQQPDAPHELLPPPQIISPQPEQKLHEAQLLFSWEPVAKAGRYQLEISGRADFAELLATEKVSGQSFQWQAPSSGLYFFRMKTIDQDGCPGPNSEPASFFVDLDSRPPFLVLRHPDNDMMLADKDKEKLCFCACWSTCSRQSLRSASLSGSASEEATLTLNGKTVILTDRRFNETVALNEGGNELVLAAEDAAGNRSLWKVLVLRDSLPPEILSAAFSPPETKGGEVVRLTARIEDAGVGAARSGSFAAEVNGQPFQGILNRSGQERHHFTGSIFIPPGLAGTVKLLKIEAQDMLGNAAAFSGE